MMQDYSSVFVGKQTIRIRAVSFRNHSRFRKVAGAVLTGALVIGIVSNIVFGLLIRSGVKELNLKHSVKLELIKNQQKLYEQRSVLLDKNKIELAAANLGLYSPREKQLRHL